MRAILPFLYLNRRSLALHINLHTTNSHNCHSAQTFQSLHPIRYIHVCYTRIKTRQSNYPVCVALLDLFIRKQNERATQEHCCYTICFD